ncbi:MAG TPA: hypothetical protein VHM24_08910 [Gemmatimonadaceae bacterium]|nr:hypothetical protein [Gemmatimonadaceae bacterium]
MADIPIQPKRSTSILPWIIGAIVVALLLWFLLARRADDDDRPAGADTTKTSSLVTPAQYAGAWNVTTTHRRT